MTTPSPKEISEAIAIICDSRDTHVLWIDYYVAGGDLDKTAGDKDHHEKCVEGYNKVLSVLGRLH